MSEFHENPQNEEIVDLLKKLDDRINRVENYLQLPPLVADSENQPKVRTSLDSEMEDEALEFRIGQFWFAKVGIIVLAIGIAFLLTFPYQNLPVAIPSIFGYLLVAVIISLSFKFAKNLSHISGYLLGGGLALLYFSTLRLFYFSTMPVISDLTLEVILLLVVNVLILAISVRKGSVFITGLSIFFFYVTAVIADNYFAMVSILLVVAITTLILKLKHNWNYLLAEAIVLTFLTYLLWYVNNPFLGKEMQYVQTSWFTPIPILVFAYIFFLGNYLRGEDKQEYFQVVPLSVINLAFAYGTFLLITLTSETTLLGGYHVLASALFLILSISFWTEEKSKFSTFFYAMTGYLALSVAIVNQFNSPDYFIWLCWQSLIVVTTAVWFRSRYIILANFIIFLVVLLAYIAQGGTLGLVSSSFGIVALISARILNWKKDKLELKTEQMRNAYLVTALLIIPYALYNTMPETLVSVSWVAVAVVYYVLSKIIKNKKYRWMSLLTLLMTVVYVFIIGITSEDPTYKIVSFLVLGVALLVFSIVYARAKSSINEDGAKVE